MRLKLARGHLMALIFCVSVLLTCCGNRDDNLTKGMDYLKEGDSKKAREFFESKISKDKDNKQLYLDIAYIYDRMGFTRDGRYFLNMGEEIFKGDRDFALMTIDTYINDGNYNGAKEVILKHNPYKDLDFGTRFIQAYNKKMFSNNYSYDEDYNNQALWNSLKNLEGAGESKEFLEAAMESFSRERDGNDLSDVLSLMKKSKLEFDQRVINNTYILNEEFRDSFGDILDTDFGDFNLVEDSFYETHEDVHGVDFVSGYFRENGKLDYIVQYSEMDSVDSIVELYDGKTGKEIGRYKLDNDYGYIESSYLINDGVKDRYIPIFSDGEIYNSPLILSFDGNKLVLEKISEYEDIKAKFIDDFLIRLERGNNSEAIVLQIKPKYIGTLVDQGFYDKGGKSKSSEDVSDIVVDKSMVELSSDNKGLLRVYSDLKFVNDGGSGKLVERIYSYDGGKANLLNMELMDYKHNHLILDETKGKDFKKIDFNSVLEKGFDTENFVGSIKYLSKDYYNDLKYLGKDIDDIVAKYGEPDDVGYDEGEYSTYANSNLFIFDDNIVRRVNGYGFYGNMTMDDLVERYGEDYEDYYGEPDGIGYEEYYLYRIYEDGKYIYRFINYSDGRTVDELSIMEIDF